MQIDIENGRRFNEEPAIEAVSSGADIFLVRLADGSGVKALPLSALKTFISGDLSALNTEDKESLVGAINEIFSKTGENTISIGTINGLVDALKVDGAARANSLVFEKNLGNSFTAEQSADIREGKFEKVRVGGYWTINGRKYWAAHADYRLFCGDSELTTHHMLVIPDKALYNRSMNDGNVTNGAYLGSNMKTSGLANALATVKQDFGSTHILSHRILLANAVSNGASAGWSWQTSQIDLMNEHMVHGSFVWGGKSQNGHDVGIDQVQLALFQARPDLIHNRQNWWLRDIPSTTSFCIVAYDGAAGVGGASSSLGVRPAFLIY